MTQDHHYSPQDEPGAPQLPGVAESAPKAKAAHTAPWAPQRPRRPRWRPGDRVRTDASVKPRKYADRAGTVREVRRTSPAGTPATYEVGVALNERDAGGAVVWFRSNELGVAAR